MTEPGGDEVTHVSAGSASSQLARLIRSCIPPGPSSPACSAIVQQFLIGNDAINPAMKSRTRRRFPGG
jgi:hypothetical protein